MKWFGRKAAPARARPFLLRTLQGVWTGEPVPRSYETQVREAYLRNPVAQRAVRLRRLMGEAETAVGRVGGALDGWRVVTMRFVRSRLVRERGGPWAAVIEYKARMLASAPEE